LLDIAAGARQTWIFSSPSGLPAALAPTQATTNRTNPIHALDLT
jgi:hypothetical protein